MNLTYAHGLATTLYLIKGDIHKAIPWLEHALSVCQARNIVLLSSTISVNLAYAYALAQRDAEVLPLLEVDGIVRSPERLVETYLLLGRAEDAYAHAVLHVLHQPLSLIRWPPG